MPGFPREELEEMVRRWVAANDRAGQTGDWKAMAEFYTPDAVYSWNNGPRHEFVARGREQIRDWVFGTEMEGLEGWQYPYVRVLIDEVQGEVLAIWRQVAPGKGERGETLEVAGTGGSWFRYAGDYRWSWGPVPGAGEEGAALRGHAGPDEEGCGPTRLGAPRGLRLVRDDSRGRGELRACRQPVRARTDLGRAARGWVRRAAGAGPAAASWRRPPPGCVP